jgi:hypothetical protein
MSKNDLSLAEDFLLRRMPWDLSRPRFMDFQSKQIQEITQADPEFLANLRQIAIEALANDKPEIVRRGLIALAFVGTEADIPQIEKLKTHADAIVSKDAATCIFEIRKNGCEK